MSARPTDAAERLRLIETFCNSATLLHGTDELRSVDTANAWLTRRGWSAIDGDDQLTRLRAERETIRDFLVDRTDPAARQALNRMLQGNVRGARIDDAGDLALIPTADVHSPSTAACEALLLHGLDAGGRRLKACASEECRYVFYDSSRSRTRTWCDMNVCGVRHKMKQYRTRLDSTSP
ncbi:MAG: CGNR zinc finger domain-containing protein [Actinomycetota bacterium]